MVGFEEKSLYFGQDFRRRTGAPSILSLQATEAKARAVQDCSVVQLQLLGERNVLALVKRDVGVIPLGRPTFRTTTHVKVNYFLNSKFVL